jgi:hypothetical protein
MSGPSRGTVSDNGGLAPAHVAGGTTKLHGANMTFPFRFGIVTLCIAVAGLTATPALAAAGGTRTTFYVTRDNPPDLPRAQVRFDDVLFALNTVQGKYKIFPLMLESRPDGSPVSLSREGDVFSINAGDHEVAGILDLAKADPELWGSLDTRLKEALLYPAGLEADETRMIYILAPAAELPGLPKSFTFFIKSLDRKLDIQKPAPTAD